MTMIRKTCFTLAVALLGTLLLATSASAQKIGTPAKGEAAKIKTVAVLPLMFQETDKGQEREVGTDNKAVETYHKALFGAFEKLGIVTVDQAKVNASWQMLGGAVFNTEAFIMPDATQLVALGKKLDVDYVAVSRCHWNIRSPVDLLGAKDESPQYGRPLDRRCR